MSESTEEEKHYNNVAQVATAEYDDKEMPSCRILKSETNSKQHRRLDGSKEIKASNTNTTRAIIQMHYAAPVTSFAYEYGTFASA